MGVLKKSTPRKSETKVIPDEKDFALDEGFAEPASLETELTKEEGQLAVDVFQTADEIIVVAPVSGVARDALEITVTDDQDKILTIRGQRRFQFKVESSDYFTQECFWGPFSRSIILPDSVDPSSVKASFKNGILTVHVPKVEKIKTRVVKIKEE